MTPHVLLRKFYIGIYVLSFQFLAGEYTTNVEECYLLKRAFLSILF